MQKPAVNLATNTERNVLLQKLVFFGMSLIFIFSQAFFFQGFNGSDDLHYAWLGARVLQGTYSPFRIDDIFSGRVLIAWSQAVIYAIGGVSTLTTQLGTYAAAVLACYFTIFKLLKASSGRIVVVATALFYFNPVLAGIALGPSPDVYILLTAVVVQILLDKCLKTSDKRHLVAYGAFLGFVVFCTLLIKETGLIFLPYTAFSILLQKGKTGVKALLSLLLVFTSLALFAGLIYHLFTGDFFFRVHQIQASIYPNPCNYTSFFSKEMYIRLTYGVWDEFTGVNYFPVLLATLAIMLPFVLKKIIKQEPFAYTTSFLILLLLALYFPFSVKGYQPLCFRSRHFLFLLPLATVISTQFLEKGFARKKYSSINIVAAVLLLAFCVKHALSGYYWNFYRCFLAFLLFAYFFRVKWFSALSLFTFILWFLLPYNYIFFRSSWFNNMQQLHKTLTGNYFYFADHDNFTHWKLINHFDTSVHCYNLDPNPFKGAHPYPYYEPLHFQPGWYISNKNYTVRTGNYLQKVDSLEQAHYFSKTYHTRNVAAYYLSSPQQFYYLRSLVELDKKTACPTCPK